MKTIYSVRKEIREEKGEKEGLQMNKRKFFVGCGYVHNLNCGNISWRCVPT